MSAIIEAINSAGQAFVEFMLPMFIQSSVLILILLALDVLLRRRVRAVFRYWLWMLVLVKLVLPPSLWSPVSIGTWLGETLESPALTVHEVPSPPHEPAPAQWQPPVALNWIEEMQASTPGVAAASNSLPMETLARVPTPEGALSVPEMPSPAAATLGWPAVVLLVWLAIVSALLLLLLQRAWFVRGLVAQAQEAPPSLRSALDQCRSRMGVARPIPLRISPNASSPAVCGLLRPVILIPQSLAPRLQPHDLRAVLLHELAHIRRGDLWVNLIQTLLQIVYFYNPLLWLANAMIRRAREQAVDEAVLVAMGETAPDYPETLLHVAKLAFHRRPTLSLRLIGVVESKSALRSRIKHILARPLPKTARLGLLGLVAVFLVAAVLLPMAKARPLTDRARRAMSLADEEARRLNHDYVGTEHILLALARQEDAVSAKALANLGADIDTLRTEVNKFVRPGAEPVTRSTLPRMPRAERAMQYAKEEAKSLGHDYIGTEHILLALLRDKDSVAAQALAGLGITETQIRAQVLTFVQPGRQDPEEDNDEGAGGGALVEPSGVAAELPNGVTMELLAYSQLTPQGLKWWTPDGKPTTIPGLYEADVEGHGTLLALRIEPEPEAGVWAWRFQPLGVSEELKPIWQVNDSDIWLVPLGEGRSYANVEIAAQVRDPVVIKTASVQQASSQDGFWVKDVTPIDADSTAFTAHGASSYSGVLMGVQVLAAIDSAGQIHAVRRIPGRSIEEQLGNPFGEPLRLQVDLPVDRFAKVVVEGYSERAGRVKFRNLSLRPGQPTEVYVEVEAEQRGPWWHRSEYDSNLEHLGRLLSEQAGTHGGQYPDDLAALATYFTDAQRNWFQEHVVYLVAGEPATKAEAVPLAYEKTLLPAGFGTYVLFGDGAVRFRTPDELVQLGITQANRTVPRRTAASEPVNQTKADEVPPPAAKAELPNGVTVEFLAYSHLVPRGGLQWLNPQGQETTIPGVYEADVEGLGTILAMRVQPSEAMLVAQVYRGPDSQNIDKPWQLPDTDIWLLPLRDERSFANLRVLTQWTMLPAIDTIAFGEENLGQLVAVNRCGIASIVDLQVVESFSADMLTNEMGQPSILGTGVATAESMGLQDVAEPPMLQFSYIRAPGSFQKVVAFLDEEGRTHPVEQVMVDSTGATYQGRIWPGRLAGILVEASAVRAADVRFRNISLTPERVTEIQIEPAARQEILWKLSYRHFVLEALINSLLRFRERHGGRFPGSLADLQNSHDPDAFRWITAHMIYIGQGKAIDDDPRSVIAYDKMLLAQGRGTYVLYSDGRVEFESPLELAERGILPPNQGGIPPDFADPSSGDGVGSNATGKPRFTVHGVVTDASGQPMEGVSVNVDCGFERPQRAGRTLTDEAGRYTLGFESAWVVADADPYGVGIQPAFVYAQKDGFYEMSLCHKGNLAMAGKAPGPDEQRFVAGRAGVVLANEPYELNFVMAPAAVLTGRLVNADGRLMANRDMYLHGDQIYPPGHSYTDVRTRSDGTFGPCTVPCTSFRLSCPELSWALSDEIAFTRAGNWRVTLKYRQTGSQTAQLLVEDLQRPTDRPSNSVSTAPQAIATAISGRVVDPNGAPAAGAQVAWIDADRSVSITDGRLMAPRFGDRGKGPIVQTDERGHFRFEEEPNDGFSLLAAHDAGFALIGSEQFAEDRVIRLQTWGRIEGRMAPGREPLEDKIWMSGLPNSTWFEHRRDYRYETLCDSDGRFTFNRVPPGWFEASYLTRMGDSVSSLTSRTPVVVEPGQTATVTLGGEGRPVIGRFVPPPDWEGPIYFGAGLRALATARPDPPRPADYDQMTQRQQQDWYRQWRKTPEAQAYYDAIWQNPNQRHYTFRIAVDGTFRIEDVIPGKYDLNVWLEERLSGGRPEEFGGYSGTVEVPPMDEAYSDEPLDVGDLVLKLRRPLHVGDLAPLFEAQTLDGKDIRLADYRGRFVLLNLWSPVFNPELDRLKELHATYRDTGKLQIIGLGGSDTMDEVKKFVAEQDVLWPQIYFGQEWDQSIAKQYGLSGLPCILLIDPDGKIVATWLREQKLTDTVREAIENTNLGVSGRILDPNGTPVHGAQVALCTLEKGIAVTGGRLGSYRLGEQDSNIRQTDGEGGFAFEQRPEDFELVVACDCGFARLTDEQFAASPVIRLQPWGRIEGTVHIGRNPGANRLVQLHDFLGTEIGNLIYYRDWSQADADGHFVFERVPPRWAEVGYMGGARSRSSRWTNGRSIHIVPGETVHVAIGATGRPVVGTLAVPPEYEMPTDLHFVDLVFRTVSAEMPFPEDYARMTQDQKYEWRQQWLSTPEGQDYFVSVRHNPNHRCYATVLETDDTFCIEDMIPGRYELTVFLQLEPPREMIVFSQGTIDIPAMAEAYSDEPLDLGELVLDTTQASVIPGLL